LLRIRKAQFINITGLVQRAVEESGVEQGVAVVFVPHTTAGVTINENADPDVVHDLLLGLDRAFPKSPAYRHGEGNSHAHLKASAMGSSVTVLVEAGGLSWAPGRASTFASSTAPASVRFLCRCWPPKKLPDKVGAYFCFPLRFGDGGTALLLHLKKPGHVFAQDPQGLEPLIVLEGLGRRRPWITFQ
jgi:secondary thiamine-phosphate synthase enzyme